MSPRYKNKRAEVKKAQIKTLSLEQADLPKRLKFNFSYLSTDPKDAYAFNELTKQELVKFLVKISAFSKESSVFWANEPVGGGGKKTKHRRKILGNYGHYPKLAQKDFPEPTYVPERVEWKKFRFEGGFRLIGFMIPPSLHDVDHKSGFKFDKNTFYAVFIDPNHKFYPTPK